MITSEEIDENNPNKAELFNIVISPDSNEQLKNFELRPFDVVSIRKMAVYERPESIIISGEVNYPGKYSLINKKSKVFEMVQRGRKKRILFIQMVKQLLQVHFYFLDHILKLNPDPKL